MRRLAEAEDRRDILKFATDLERAIAWSNPCAELIDAAWKSPGLTNGENIGENERHGSRFRADAKRRGI